MLELRTKSGYDLFVRQEVIIALGHDVEGPFIILHGFTYRCYLTEESWLTAKRLVMA